MGPAYLPFACPSCGGRFHLKGAQGGLTYLCPRCKASLVPDSTAALSIDAREVAAEEVAEAPAEVRGAGPEAQFGKYVLLRKLGEGGMGEVHLAWDRGLGRHVALKFVRHPDSDEVARLLREAKLAAGLSHPNIAPVFEAGEIGGRTYVSMLFVEGRALGGALPGREAARVVRDAARAIAHAHSRGIVHRDLKPANLMLDGDGRVFVLDFGLSKRVKAEGTVSGDIVGTPSFMAPEQAKGERVDERTDVYGLGATLYEFVSGGPPFAGGGVWDILQRVMVEDPKPVAGELGIVAAKAMEKEPARRYAGAAALAEDLDRWLTGDPIQAQAPSLWYKIQKKIRKHPALAATAALALVLGAGGTAAWFGFVRRGKALEESGKRLEEQGQWTKAIKLGKMFDETYAALRDEIRRAEDVGFNSPKLSNEAERRLMKSVDDRLAAIPKPWDETSLVPAYRGWILCNLGHIKEGEAELDRAVRLGGEARQDPYGLVFRARWKAVHLYRVSWAWVAFGGADPISVGGRSLTPEDKATLEALAREVEPIGAWTGWRETREGSQYRALMAGLAALARGRWEEAQTNFDTVAAAPEIGSEARYLTGMTYYYSGDYSKAATAWEDLALVRPRWVRALTWAGTARLTLGEIELDENPRAAAEEFDRAYDLFNKANDAVNADGVVHDAECSRSMGMALVRSGVAHGAFSRTQAENEFGMALAYYDDPLIGDPNDVQALQGRGNLRVEWGNLRAAEGKDPRDLYRPAIEDYERAAALDSRLWPTMTGLGNAWLVLGKADDKAGEDPRADFRKAVESYTAALKAKSDAAEAFNGRGAASKALGLAEAAHGGDAKNFFEAALADYDAAIEASPGFWMAFKNKGILLEAMGRRDDAVKAYEASLKIHPTQPDVEARVVRLKAQGAKF